MKAETSHLLMALYTIQENIKIIWTGLVEIYGFQSYLGSLNICCICIWPDRPSPFPSPSFNNWETKEYQMLFSNLFSPLPQTHHHPKESLLLCKHVPLFSCYPLCLGNLIHYCGLNHSSLLINLKLTFLSRFLPMGSLNFIAPQVPQIQPV